MSASSHEAADALRACLRRAHIVDGLLFRAVTSCGHVRPSALSAGDVARVIRAGPVGTRRRSGANHSGHSVRVGMGQDLHAANASLAAIMEADAGRRPRWSVAARAQSVRHATPSRNSISETIAPAESIGATQDCCSGFARCLARRARLDAQTRRLFLNSVRKLYGSRLDTF